MEIGDLVWAKIRDDGFSSSSYRPGLIQRITDSHGVLVSFLDCQNPSYFRTSELRPLADRVAACDELLDRALRGLCRRTALSLRCRCLVRSEMAVEAAAAVVGDGEAAEARKAFRAVAVAEFVRSKAVSPWVEVGDFVAAVRSVAQVQVFRDYNAAGQRLAYQKKRRRSKRGMHLVDSQPHSDSGVEESYNMDLDCGDQVTHNQLNKNMKADAVIGVNPSIFLLEESDQPLRDEKFEQNLTKDTQCEEEEQSAYGMLLNLRYLALDSSSLEPSCLNVTEQTFLRYRNFLFKKVSDVDFHKCSLKTRESFFFDPCYDSIKDDGKKCESEVCRSILPYVERPVRSVIKDKQCEEQSLNEMLVNLQCLGSDPSCLEANSLNAAEQAFLIFRSFLFEKGFEAYIRQCSPLKTREAYFSNPSYFKVHHRIEDDEKKCQSEDFGSIVPCMKTPVRRLGCKRRQDQSEVYLSAFKLSKTMPVFSIDRAGYYLQMGRNEDVVDLSNKFLSYNDMDSSVERSGIAQEASIGDPLKLEMQNSGAQISTHGCNVVLSDFSPDMSDFSLCEESEYLSNIVDTICKDQDLTEMDTSTLHFTLHDRSFGVLNNNRMSYVYNIAENKNCGVHSADTKSNYSYNSLQPSATESTLCEICDQLEANASDVANIGSNKAQMQLIGGGENSTSVISNREVVSLNLASEDRINKTEMLNNVGPCTSRLLSNSRGAQQLKAVSSFSGSTSLHIKFPRDMNLPSKEKLVRKFRQFGPIDSSKTKIFGCTGSAQVVFFKQLAAMAAYHYARGKKLLPGQPNVHYWLDPFEDKRGGAKLARKTSVPGLKSCLRNSDALKGKVEKKPQKVRFLMET